MSNVVFLRIFPCFYQFIVTWKSLNSVNKALKEGIQRDNIGITIKNMSGIFHTLQINSAILYIEKL